VAASADERKTLEQLCRYIARPAVSEKRVYGELTLKQRQEDGTSTLQCECQPKSFSFTSFGRRF
jgi:hypothetical protein